MTVEEFVKHINQKRLDSRNTTRWYGFIGEVDGHRVRVKGYKTWLQIFQVDNFNYSNPMDRKVGQFKEDLLKPFRGTII